MIDFPDSALAVESTDFAEFVQDASLRLIRGLMITFGDSVHVGFPVLQVRVLTSSPEKIGFPEIPPFPYQPGLDF
jgi:hypothetical protein